MARPLFAKLPPFSRVSLLDYNLPDTTGVRAFLPETVIIMISGRIDGLPEKTLETIGITVFVNTPLPLGALRRPSSDSSGRRRSTRRRGVSRRVGSPQVSAARATSARAKL